MHHTPASYRYTRAPTSRAPSSVPATGPARRHRRGAVPAHLGVRGRVAVPKAGRAVRIAVAGPATHHGVLVADAAPVVHVIVVASATRTGTAAVHAADHGRRMAHGRRSGHGRRSWRRCRRTDGFGRYGPRNLVWAFAPCRHPCRHPCRRLGRDRGGRGRGGRGRGGRDRGVWGRRGRDRGGWARGRWGRNRRRRCGHHWRRRRGRQVDPMGALRSRVPSPYTRTHTGNS